MSQMNWQRRWDPLLDLQRQMGRLLESIEPWPGMRLARAHPPINLYDAGDHYVLTAQVPGLSAEELDLTITGETLTIRGGRNRPEGVSEEAFRRQERPFGRWSRALTLPERVEAAAVAASIANGILSVVLPKIEDAKPRQITVTTSQA